MRRLLLLFLSLQIVSSLCPQGYELFGSECRGLFDRVKMPFNEATQTAVAKCNGILSHPVIIHDQETEDFWEKMAHDSGYIMIGLVCNTDSMKWEWSDGSAVDYKPPEGKYHPDLEMPCSGGTCTWMLFQDQYTWFKDCQITDKHKFSLYCTAPLRQPDASPDGCDGFADDSVDGLCYQVGATAENWNEAQMNCKNLGGDLASIHNIQENAFIRRLAASKGAVNGLFIGAVREPGAAFKWSDNSTWDYTNFYPGFPIAGLSLCLAMDTSSSSGQWMNMPCSAKLPVACARAQRPDVKAACSSVPPKENTMISSPGFPVDASVPCEYFLVAEAGKTVQLEVTLLEANPCCDYLVIHDGYLGGNMIANLTGESRGSIFTSTSNVMRVNWVPQGGVNVKGVVMTFHGV